MASHITDQRAVKSRIFDKVFADCCRDRGHIADMLHHRRKRDRSHNKNRGNIEFAQRKLRDTHRCGAARIDAKSNVRRAVPHSSCAQRVKDERGAVGNNDTHENRDDFKHSLAPDIENDNGCECDQREQPVGGGVADGRACKA